MDAKSSATMLRENSAKYMLWSHPEFFILITHLRCLPIINIATKYLEWHSLLGGFSRNGSSIYASLVRTPYRHPPARYGRRHHYVQYALPDRWLSSDQDQQHYVLHYSSWFQWIKTLCRIPANFLCTCANLPILWSTLHTGCQDFKGKGGQWLPRESKQCWTEKQSIRVAWGEAAVCWFAYCENKRASATFSRPRNCSWHWTYFLNNVQKNCGFGGGWHP